MNFEIKKNLFKLKYLPFILKSKKLNKNLKKKFINEKELFIREIDKKNYTNKWFLNNFDIFHNFFPKYSNKKFSYLEIGSFEGLSANYVLHHFKKCNLYAIDLWGEANLNSDKLNVNFKEIENRFDSNLSRYEFIKLKGDSVTKIRELIKKKIYFDYFYIDGSHTGEDILSDAIECYKLLKKSGYIIFDDINASNKSLNLQPFEAFDLFNKIHKKKIEIKYLGNIAVIQKIN